MKLLCVRVLNGKEHGIMDISLLPGRLFEARSSLGGAPNGTFNLCGRELLDRDNSVLRRV